MSGRLAGKSALVTGAASGFGAAIAERYAAQGARVLIADLNFEGAKAVAGRVRGEALVCDVADRVSVAAAVRHGVARFGRIDIVVNTPASRTPTSLPVP